MANWWRCTNVCSVCQLSVYKRFPLSDYRVLLEKLTVSQPVKKFLALYAIRTFIAAFTTAPPPVPVLCHSNPIKAQSCLLRILLILFFHLILGLALAFSNRFPHQKPSYSSPFPRTCHMLHPSQSSWFYDPNHSSLRVQIMQLLITQFSSVTSSLIPPRPYLFQTTL